MSADLESMLMELARHGRPRISQTRNSKWVCVLEMFTAVPEGASLEARSSFEEKSPGEAAAACLRKLAEIQRAMNAARMPEEPKTLGERCTAREVEP